jgi:hypothetical protein
MKINTNFEISLTNTVNTNDEFAITNKLRLSSHYVNNYGTTINEYGDEIVLQTINVEYYSNLVIENELYKLYFIDYITKDQLKNLIKMKESSPELFKETYNKLKNEKNN